MAVELATRVLAGERRALAKAVTLVESTRAEDKPGRDALLATLGPHGGGALRLGVSGAPGAGKSTFVEALGLWLVERGHRVAVLAVDPSSERSGGAILGDKTRMERLSVHPSAFVRPSPSSGTLGGVARRTREVILLFEAARYDVVLVETVGVGQSETAVQGMTDVFVLLQLPNTGDELQAMKKGTVELADLIVVNKADLDPVSTERACRQLEMGLSSLPSRAGTSGVEVIGTSALVGTGIGEVWAGVERFLAAQRASGDFATRRRSQSVSALWEVVRAELEDEFRSAPAVLLELSELTQRVEAGALDPSTAARRLLAAFLGK